MSIRIITDSASDISQFEAQKLGITVLPLKTLFGTEEYLDGVNLSHEEFYHKLIESDILPTTSQIPPYDYEEAFRAAVENGDDVVCITLSSKLSGCYQSAMIAAEEFPGRVMVVDSLNVAIGERCLIELALQARDTGKTSAQIAALLNEEKHNIHLVALLDTLEYLKKGGRISSTVALAGTLLNIKPVIAVEDGEVAILGKARGSKNGGNMLMTQVEQAGGIDFSKPFSLAYTGLSDALLNKYIEDSATLYKNKTDYLPVYTIGSTIGTHVGPGAIAVAFFGNN